eukprot:jgi/Orpsp1_1/1182117/evm.model.c7180000079958.2
MKTSIVLTLIAALTAKVSASCFSESLGYPCCKKNSTSDVVYSDKDGDWGIENGSWCGIGKEIPSCWATSLGYPCCTSSDTKVNYTDKDGDWGIENNSWCGIEKKTPSCGATNIGFPCCTSSNTKSHFRDENGYWGIENGKWCGIIEKTPSCWAASLGFPCCTSSNPKVVYTDDSGKWGIENDEWCGIIEKEPKPNYSEENPFYNVEFYLNPYYVNEIDLAIEQMTDSSLIHKAKKMQTYPTAIWLNNLEDVKNWLRPNLKAANAQQLSTGKNVLTVFVLNNLPGRNCNYLVSYGEFMMNETDAQRYKNEYIDEIEEALKYYKSQPVVFIVEPGALASLVTYTETTPACAEAEKYYLDGHAYLIKKLGLLPNVSLYLDIGFNYWLGWDDYRYEAAKLYASVINSGSPGKVRGFASNVANYTPWVEPPDPRGPDYEWDPCPDEMRYLTAMYKDFISANIKSVHFISDTSRNGHKLDRTHPSYWCNQKGVGAGPRPMAYPVIGMDYIDAFYWIKPLGESDGYSDGKGDQIDDDCNSRYSMKPAPKEGEWFQEYFIEGIMNAMPPL